MEVTMNFTDEQLSVMQMLGFIDADLPLDDIQPDDVTNGIAGLIENAADRAYAASEQHNEIVLEDKKEFNEPYNLLNQENKINDRLYQAVEPSRPQISFDNTDLQRADLLDVGEALVIDPSTAQDIMPEINSRAVTAMKTEAVQAFAEAMDAFMAKHDIQNYSERFTDGMHYTDAIANDIQSGQSDWIRSTLQDIIIQNITSDPEGKQDITYEAADLNQKLISLVDGLEKPEQADVTVYTTDDGALRVRSDEILKGFGMMDVEIPLSQNEKASLDAAVEEVEKNQSFELE